MGLEVLKDELNLGGDRRNKIESGTCLAGCFRVPGRLASKTSIPYSSPSQKVLLFRLFQSCVSVQYEVLTRISLTLAEQNAAAFLLVVPVVGQYVHDPSRRMVGIEMQSASL